MTRKDTVPLQPFLDAYERSGMTPTELAYRLGYMRGKRGKAGKQPDSSRALRVLGIIPQSATTKSGKYYAAKMKTEARVQYDVAVRLAKALNLDPWEAGV